MSLVGQGRFYVDATRRILNAARCSLGFNVLRRRTCHTLSTEISSSLLRVSFLSHYSLENSKSPSINLRSRCHLIAISRCLHLNLVSYDMFTRVFTYICLHTLYIFYNLFIYMAHLLYPIVSICLRHNNAIVIDKSWRSSKFRGTRLILWEE